MYQSPHHQALLVLLELGSVNVVAPYIDTYRVFDV
jgi:hypothetical protein